MEFGYWDIRGLAQPFRLMFAYKGGDAVTDKQYVIDKNAEGSWESAWFKEAKPELIKKQPLINLPYLVDGDVIVTQSNAIWTYLGRKWDLYGKTDAERADVDTVLNQVMDLRNAAIGPFYSGEGGKEGVVKYATSTAKGHLNKLNSWLAFKNAKFAVSDEITIADFHLYEMLWQHSRLIKDCLEAYPALKSYYENFAAQDFVKAFEAGPNGSLPINNKMAQWGATNPAEPVA